MKGHDVDLAREGSQGVLVPAKLVERPSQVLETVVRLRVGFCGLLEPLDRPGVVLLLEGSEAVRSKTFGGRNPLRRHRPLDRELLLAVRGNGAAERLVGRDVHLGQGGLRESQRPFQFQDPPVHRVDRAEGPEGPIERHRERQARLVAFRDFNLCAGAYLPQGEGHGGFAHRSAAGGFPQVKVGKRYQEASLVPVGGDLLDCVELHSKRGRHIQGVGDRNVLDRHLPPVADHALLDRGGPTLLRHCREEGPEPDLHIGAKEPGDPPAEHAFSVESALEEHILSRQEGRLLGGAHEKPLPVGLDQQGALVPQAGQQVPGDPEGVRAVYPQPVGGRRPQAHDTDHMVELLGARHVVAEVVAGAVDQDWPHVDAQASGEGRQKCVFVLAVAIPVLEDLGRRAGLHASNAEAHIEIADVRRDECVEGPDFLAGGGRSPRKARRFLGHRGIRLQAVLRKLPPPAGHVGPGAEIRKDDVGLDPPQPFRGCALPLLGGQLDLEEESPHEAVRCRRHLLPRGAEALAQADLDSALARYIELVDLEGDAHNRRQLHLAENTPGCEGLPAVDDPV